MGLLEDWAPGAALEAWGASPLLPRLLTGTESHQSSLGPWNHQPSVLTLVPTSEQMPSLGDRRDLCLGLALKKAG